MTERLPALTLPATPGQADAAIADLLDACAEAYAREPGADLSRIEDRIFGKVLAYFHSLPPAEGVHPSATRFVVGASDVPMWEVPPVAPDLPTVPAPTTPDDVPEAIAAVLGAVAETMLGTIAETPYAARLAAYGRVLAHLRPRLERRAREARP